MNHTKDVTIGKRLYRSYLTILGVACLIIVVSLSVLLYSYRQMNLFYHEPYEGVKTTLTLYGNMESTEKNILKSIVLQNEYSTQYMEEANSEFEDLMQGMTGLKEKELAPQKQYVQLEQLVSDLDRYIKDIVQLIGVENYEKALQLYNNQCKLSFEEGKKTLLKMHKQASEHATASINRSKWFTFVSVAACLMITLLGIFFVLSVIKRTVTRIVVPIQSFVVGIKQVAEGKLDGHIEYEYQDELGDLSNHMNRMMAKLKEMIENIEETVESLNKKEYAINIEKEYIGDFAKIKCALKELIVTLRSMVVRMGDCSDVVLHRANQLAEISNKMAGDASGQETAVDQLICVLGDVNTKLQQNVTAFHQTKNSMEECFSVSNEGQKQIDLMRRSLHHINEHYAKIETVMSMMEEFAKKTKLLALNATIESARYGSMGNGFTVVAEEIRVIADQSKEAVEEVKKFISDAVVILQEGNEIADGTHRSFTHLQGAIAIANEKVEMIAGTMKMQETMVRQVREGMKEFMEYSHKANVTAQETLSASELLRNESIQLDQFVKQFKV